MSVKAPGPGSRPHQARQANAAHNLALLIRLAGLPAAGQYRPPCPRRGVGGEGLAVGDAGPLLRRFRRCLPYPGACRTGWFVGDGHLGPNRADACTPTRPRSCASARGREGSISWASVTAWWSPGSTRAATTCRSGLRVGPWPPSGPRSENRTPGGYASLDMAVVVENLNPVLRGWGAYFRYGDSSRKFNAVDGYIHQRLAKLASVKDWISGLNRTTRFTYGWLTSLGDLPADRDGAPLGCECLMVKRCRGAVCGRSCMHGSIGGRWPSGPPTAKWKPTARRVKPRD